MLPRPSAVLAPIIVAPLAIVGSACGGEPAETELVVHAASSLTEVFTLIGDRFESDHPGVEVTFNFAASSELTAQLAEGIPGDVVATADPTSMTAVDDLLAGPPTVFATNHPVIAVPAGNPAGIEGIADLADPGVVLVVCAPTTPCGAYAEQWFDLAGIEPEPDSAERNVKSVLAKVSLGEADAGIVYATDVTDDSVEVVPDPTGADVTASYPIAVTAAAGDPDLAQAFVDTVTGPTGRTILDEAGFGSP